MYTKVYPGLVSLKVLSDDFLIGYNGSVEVVK